MAALPGLRALPNLYLEIVRRVREQRGNAEAARGDLLTTVMRIAADEIRQLAAFAVYAEKVETGHRFRVRAVRGLTLRSEGHRRDVKGSVVLARTGIRRALGFIEWPGEVDEVPQGDRVQRLELAQLLGVSRVRRLTVGDRERGLPGARPDPECRLEPGVTTLAEHRRTREAFLGDAVPGEAALIGGAERLQTDKARDLGREADGRELPAVAAELMDSEGRHDLLDALAERLEEIAERVRVGGGDRVLQQEVRIHGIRTQCERDHHIVEVPDAPRGDHERAVPSQRRLRDERAMRRRDNEVRIEPRASLAQDTLVANDDELRAAADAACGRRTKPRQRVARVLLPIAIGLQEDRRDSRIRCEPSDHVIDQPCALLTREGAEVVAPQTGPGRVATKEQWRRELDPPPRVVCLRRGPRAEQSTRGEMLDLALAVDRGIRHHRHRLVEMVREVRARCESGERTVVAEGTDRLVAGLDHKRGHLQVVGLEAKRRELPLAAD